MKNFIAAIAMIGTAILPMAAAAYEATENRCDHFEKILMDMERAGGIHVANIPQNGEELEVFAVENRYYILDWNDEEICSSPAPKWVVDQIKR